MKLKLLCCMSLCFSLAPVNAGILADYVFEENLGGNIFGAPNLEFLGVQENYVTGQVAGFDVSAISIPLATGLRLDLSQWSICDEYTLVLHGMLNEVNGYRKLIDFRSLSGDTGLYNRTGFVEYVSGAISVSSVVQPGQYFRLVFTRDNSNSVNVYIDGELVLTFVDNPLGTAMCFTDELYFFKDDSLTGNEEPSGAVARLTVYDHALTADEVGELEITDVIFFSDFEIIQVP